MKEKWIKGEPGGPVGPFWSVVSSSGRVIALALPDEKIADLLVYLKDLLECELETIEQISNRLVGILERDFPNKSIYKYPIEPGTYDYVIRSIIEAIFEGKLE